MKTPPKIYALILLLLVSINVPAQIAGDWKSIGPIQFPINKSGQIHGIGRISQIKFHPSNSSKIYAVSATGGLYISNDAAQSWSVMGTDNLFRTNISSVCIDHTNDQVLYISTGDANYYSNYYGIYKSTDGGATWKAANTGIGSRMAVEILMSPSNNNVLIAATKDGIWKTTDAGATWTVKKSGGDFTDMIFKPGDPNTIYAATQTQFFVSTNMGDTWTAITLPGNGFVNGGRIGVTKANPNVVYVTFVGDFNAGTSTPVLKSTNSGQSFSIVRAAGNPNLNGYSETQSGQGNYNYGMTVDPTNENIVYIVGHVIWKSTNGGVSWTKLTDWWATIHTDMHQVIFSPYDNTKLFNANDGGVWLSTNGGVNWSPVSNGLGCTEVYHAAQSPVKKDMIDIGTQDNGELHYISNTWYTNGGGDFAGNIIFDYQNTTDVYHLGNDQNRKRLSGTGSAPTLGFPFAKGDDNGNDVRMAFNPLQTSLGFVSKTEVWRTTNLASAPPAWTQISNINVQIQALGSSPADANLLYAVTNDNRIFRSDNALAASPSFVSLAAPAATNVKASVACIKNNASVVYVTCGSKVYRSADKGVSWSNVTGTLPNVNILAIYHDNYSNDESVYVGTAKAVYYKNNTMSDWINYSKGLPTVSNINEFMLYNDGTSNSELRVAFFGRGVWGSSLYGKAALRDPENPALTTSGVDYKYYEGTWTTMPDFNALNPVKTGNVSTFSLTPKNKASLYGFRYTGYIDVPTDGQYTFYTTSDDGSNLYIGSTKVVGNDGLHGAIEQSGIIGLKAGKHAITIDFFQNGGGDSLVVSYSGPGITKKAIPASVLYRIPPETSCGNNGTITREVWSNYTGSTVTGIPVNNTPSTSGILTSFSAPVNFADSYGQRIRGYICPPYTGNYTFWIASDDDSELWLSTDNNPSNKVKIASITGWVNEQDWTALPSQKSASIALVAGQQYYIEALHREGAGGDHLSVGWQLPTGTLERPIPGKRLSPIIPIAPYGGTAWDIPGKIEAENYDLGGQGFSYLDTDRGNNGSAFRTDDVDIEATTDAGGGYNLGWIAAGEWLRYTVNVNTSGIYNIEARVAALQLPSSFHIELDGTNISGTIAVPVTGAYQTFKSVIVNTPSLSTGKKVMKIVMDGKEFNLNYVNFTLNQKPAVSITAPVNNAVITLPATVNITADASDVDGTISKVQFYSGATLLGTSTTAPYTFAWSNVASGTYSLTAKATDNTGQVTTSSAIKITVNAPPSVTITSPANNTTASVGDNITITASALDTDGNITKVEFFNGDILLGSKTVGPFSYNLTNAAAGNYSITAVATDNNGSKTTSSPVTLQVNNNPVLTFNDITKTFGDPVFSVNATSSSPGAITYSIVTGAEFASITSEGQITITGAGTVTLKASQAAAAGYNAGTATATLTINKSGQNNVSYTGLTTGSVGDQLNLSVTSSSTGAVTYEILPGGTAQGTISGNTLTLTEPGTLTVQITVAADNNYSSQVITQEITVLGPTGLTTKDKAFGLNIFPNPATDKVTILFEKETRIGEVVIMDINGQIVFEKRDLTGKQLDVRFDPPVASGVYIIKIKSDFGSFERKVIFKQ